MHSNPAVHFSVFLNKDVVIFDTARLGGTATAQSSPAPSGCAPVVISSSLLLPPRDRVLGLAFGPPFQSAPEGELDTHGPLWNCRLEPELQESSGTTKFHRITITSTFSVKRQDTSQISHSLITLRFGCALILTMAEYKDYYLLIQNWPFVRMLLHHVTGFGVQSAVSYIGKVLRLSTAKQAEAACQEDPRGLETLLMLRELIHNLVGTTWSLPSLTSFSGLVNQPPPLYTPRQSANSSPANTPQSKSSIHVRTQFLLKPPQSVDSLLCSAMQHVQTTCSLDFLSSVVSGCLACSRWSEYDVEGVFPNDYADFQRNPDVLKLRSPGLPDTDTEEDDGSSQDLGRGEDLVGSQTVGPDGILGTSPPPQRPVLHIATGKRLQLTEANLAANEAIPLVDETPNAPAVAAEEAPRRRVTRIVVLTDDEQHGASLLVICAFFFRPGKLAVCEHSSASKGVLPCVIASHSDSCAHPSFPIQWVSSLITAKKRQDVTAELHNRFSVENEVLVIDPRLLKVNLMRLEKTFSTADVVVSRENGEVREPDGPVFSVRKLDDVEILANEPIKKAIASAANAEKKSIGAVNAADCLENMIELYYHQALTYRTVVTGGLLKEASDAKPPTTSLSQSKQTLVLPGSGAMVLETGSTRSNERLEPPGSARVLSTSPRRLDGPAASPRSASPGGPVSPSGAVGGIPQQQASLNQQQEMARDAARRYNEAIRFFLGLEADATHLQLLSYISGLKP